MMPDISPGTPLHSALEIIRKAISDVFSQALSSQWTVELKPDDSDQQTDAPCLRFGFSLSGGLDGNAVLQVPTAASLMLAQKFLGESAGESADLTNEHKEALEELLRQVAGLAETALKAAFGDLKVQVSLVQAPSAPGMTVLLLASEVASGTHRLMLQLSNELMGSLSAHATASAAKKYTEECQPSENNNLDLLLGVDLSLTLRFGQRVLTLREILDLTSGSVIELDRQVQEPADLLLGDKLIARGEVVIVDGNYGLRITEVVDPRQRIGAV
jgi:flagellar motor switch protein FliN/FliY